MLGVSHPPLFLPSSCQTTSYLSTLVCCWKGFPTILSSDGTVSSAAPGSSKDSQVSIPGRAIFHCACLLGSLELVSSLSPMCDIHRLTDHGDSPLYLAFFAAAHKFNHDKNGVEVIQHLLQAGSQINQTNLAGLLLFTRHTDCPALSW